MFLYRDKNKDIRDKVSIRYDINKDKVNDVLKALNKARISEEFNVLDQIDNMDIVQSYKSEGISSKNRYCDILPFSFNSVLLDSKAYINASWIHVSRY